MYATIKNVTMSKIKGTSTHNENKQHLISECIEVYAASLIGGQWTLHIWFYLISGKKRFGELKKQLPNVTERMLTLHLRKMEKNNLVKRTVYPEVPLRVEYELTKSGKALKVLFKHLAKWGEQHKEFERNL